MSETVVTIVGSVDKAVENRAAALIREAGVEGIECLRLDSGLAVDFVLPVFSDALVDELRRKFAHFGSFDIFVQPNDAFRRKKMLIADMDATMVENETLDDLAGLLGLKDQVAPITAAAMRGELDFKQALAQRVLLLKGMPVEKLMEAIDHVRFTKGADKLVKTMARHGAHCVLISGGFDIFTRHVAGVLGFHKNFGNTLGVAGGRLTGEVIPPIVDKDVKKKTLEEEARARQIDLRAVMSVGDGANDIPMLQTAGAGVGYFGKPAVQTATPYQVRYTDLTALLFMQGYSARDFAA